MEFSQYPLSASDTRSLALAHTLDLSFMQASHNDRRPMTHIPVDAWAKTRSPLSFIHPLQPLFDLFPHLGCGERVLEPRKMPIWVKGQRLLSLLFSIGWKWRLLSKKKADLSLEAFKKGEPFSYLIPSRTDVCRLPLFWAKPIFIAQSNLSLVW